MTKQVGYIPENITRIELENYVNAGVRWGALDVDMVPIFEEHAARLEKNYKLIEWYELDKTERAMIIAVRRIDIAAKNQQTEAEIKKAQSDAKRTGKR